MKLKVKDIDFEALIKDLPMSNPFMLEVSNIYDEHDATMELKDDNKDKSN